MLQQGDAIPNFSVTNHLGEVVSNTTIKHQRCIFYFYPKADTPGCTTESKEFSEALPRFESNNIRVFGVSKDTVKKNHSFCSKYDFKHTLLCDDASTLCEDFGVWQEKSMYGKTYFGIVRSTFLINSDGVIEHVWSSVKVNGHVEAIFSVI